MTHLHFVVGKGGVGRTTVSAALALALAREGGRVLVAELDELAAEGKGAKAPGNFPALLRAFGRMETPTGEQAALPIAVSPGVEAVRLRAPLGHEAFLRASLPGGALLSGALRSAPIRRFLEAAPSLHELGQLAHLASLVGGFGDPSVPSHFAHAVVDLPATGHALALVQLPDAVRRIIPVGPVARRLSQAAELMRDPRRCEVYVVTLPETLPVSETLELLAALSAHRIDHPKVIVNRWPIEPLGAVESAAAEALIERHPGVQGARTLRALKEGKSAAARLPSVLCHLPAVYGCKPAALLESLAGKLAGVPGIGAPQ